MFPIFFFFTVKSSILCVKSRLSSSQSLYQNLVWSEIRAIIRVILMFFFCSIKTTTAVRIIRMCLLFTLIFFFFFFTTISYLTFVFVRVLEFLLLEYRCNFSSFIIIFFFAFFITLFLIILFVTLCNILVVTRYIQISPILERRCFPVMFTYVDKCLWLVKYNDEKKFA